RQIADTLILNAAVALYVYGCYPSIAESVAHAHDNLFDGSALRLLKNWSAFSHD
ncbi:MAG TPA: anthranilate phosphoribosyltransferase, partial [Legionella sp.]|nr:anthranilate phosphoribosyltransferase [Legionella sp.]